MLSLVRIMSPEIGKRGINKIARDDNPWKNDGMKIRRRGCHIN